MDKFTENFNCSICLDYCKVAVECSNCHNLFCESCTNSLDKNICPLCRAETQFQASHFVRRLINNLPTKCNDCQKETTIGELNKHKEICIEVCKTNVEKTEYKDHFSKSHSMQICDKLPLINETIITNLRKEVNDNKTNRNQKRAMMNFNAPKSYCFLSNFNYECSDIVESMETYNPTYGNLFLLRENISNGNIRNNFY